MYEKVVDLGEYSGGKQTFQGETPDELIDALAKAQRHATAKIRKQALEIKKLKALLRANWGYD
jgi:hypothetical protein